MSFSVAMYNVISSELERVGRVQRFRVERGMFYGSTPVTLVLDADLISETKNRLVIILAAINVLILGTSAAAGFFLAGRTLRPIKDMVDEQNRFITDASHELRTPLTALKSEIEVNLRDRNLTLQDAKDLLKSNLEEANNLQILSDDLIKLTQYQKGDNGLEVSSVSLSEVSAEAVKKVAGLAKAKKIEIAKNIAAISVEGNRQLLTELLVIFLDNAIKYSPTASKVNLSAKKTDGHVNILVTDQGMGISGEDLPHVFDRFYRADKSRAKSDVQGYGLGLSIAKQIIERHHGSVRIQSEVGKGTTFIVTLPVKHSGS